MQAAVAKSRGLFALAINEDTIHDAYYEGCNLVQELVKATGIRVAIMSPQMLQSVAMSSLIDNSPFITRFWMGKDEADDIDGVCSRLAGSIEEGRDSHVHSGVHIVTGILK